MFRVELQDQSKVNPKTKKKMYHHERLVLFLAPDYHQDRSYRCAEKILESFEMNKPNMFRWYPRHIVQNFATGCLTFGKRILVRARVFSRDARRPGFLRLQGNTVGQSHTFETKTLFGPIGRFLQYVWGSHEHEKFLRRFMKFFQAGGPVAERSVLRQLKKRQSTVADIIVRSMENSEPVIRAECGSINIKVYSNMFVVTLNRRLNGADSFDAKKCLQNIKDSNQVMFSDIDNSNKEEVADAKSTFLKSIDKDLRKALKSFLSFSFALMSKALASEDLKFGYLAGLPFWVHLNRALSSNSELRSELLDAAEYAELSYHHSEDEFIENLLQLRCMGHRVSDNGLLAILGWCNFPKKERRLFISIRGTFIRDNWYVNLNAKKIPYDTNGCKNCLVHRGWLNNYKTFLAGQLTEYITDALDLECSKSARPPKDIIVTGHSMGGAMAVFATLDVVEIKRKMSLSDKYRACRLNETTIKMITFAQPRVGNEAFTHYFVNDMNESKSKFARVVNLDDRVPTLPFKMFGYDDLPNMLLVRGWGTTNAIWDNHRMPFYRDGIRQALNIKHDASHST